MPTAFALCLMLAAAGPAGDAPSEPGLAETQEAAARAAGGRASDDDSRESRARLAHWAPQLRAQGQVRDDEKARVGEFRLAPVREQDVGVGHSWTVGLAWDFSQVIYARDESQLALAHAHLARIRREASEKAAQLWIERRTARAHWLASGPEARLEACLSLLRLTSALDALTSGLFGDALAREETACAGEEKR